MKLSAKPKYWFYPDWNGNLKLPENDRVAIEILRPAGEERGNLIFYETVQEIQTMKSSKLATVKSVSIKTRFNVSEILRKHVGRVRNLEADEEKIRMVEGKNEETYTETVILDNGEKIAESGAFGIARLIDLICSEVTSDTLTASEKKSS